MRILALLGLTVALTACGSAPTAATFTPSTPAERDAYTQCKKWAQQGQSQQTVGAEIGTYVAANSFSASENDRVTKACAHGFADGGG